MSTPAGSSVGVNQRTVSSLINDRVHETLRTEFYRGALVLGADEGTQKHVVIRVEIHDEFVAAKASYNKQLADIQAEV